jgi:erythromycin esterase-like protein
MEIKTVRPAQSRSFEAHCRDTRVPGFFLDLGTGQDTVLRARLAEPMLQRAIGAVYRPESELASHYFEAEPAHQFDAWVWFEETKAVSASAAAGDLPEPDAFPSGI